MSRREEKTRISASQTPRHRLARRLLRELAVLPFGIAVALLAIAYAFEIPGLREPSLAAQSYGLSQLELAHLEIRSEKEFFERRVALVDKLGLAPGLLAALVSLGQLHPSNSWWVLSLAYATPALYVLGAMAHFLAMRLDRMTKLLELLVARKKSRNPLTERTSKGRFRLRSADAHAKR